MTKKYSHYEFYNNVAPIKLTEARRIKLHTKGWGILTDYYLESVKINHRKGIVTSAATLRIVDKSGQITCIVKGSIVGLLFALPAEEWKDVENLCYPGQQLFYRNFKDGISKNFNYEQKLFYTFCASNQSNEPYVATFVRCLNTRNNFRNDSCIEIIDIIKYDDHLLNLYKSHLRDDQGN